MVARESFHPLLVLVGPLGQSLFGDGVDAVHVAKKINDVLGTGEQRDNPWMTMRSKQWYTKASRLPNSLVKVSIGPPGCFCLDNKIIGQRTGGNPARDVA